MELFTILHYRALHSLQSQILLCATRISWFPINVSSCQLSCTAECFVYIKGMRAVSFPGPSLSAAVLCPPFGCRCVIQVEVRKRGAVLVALPFINPAICQWQMHFTVLIFKHLFQFYCHIAFLQAEYRTGETESLLQHWLPFPKEIANFIQPVGPSFQFSLIWWNLLDVCSDFYESQIS